MKVASLPASFVRIWNWSGVPKQASSLGAPPPAGTQLSAWLAAFQSATVRKAPCWASFWPRVVLMAVQRVSG